MPEEGTVDLSLEPKDIKNPKLLVKKGLTVLEVGLGGFAHGALKEMVGNKIPIDSIWQEALTLTGSMLIAGAISQKDLNNILGGVSAASGSNIAREIIAKLKSWVNKEKQLPANESVLSRNTEIANFGISDPF